MKGDDTTVNDGLAVTLRSLCEEHGLIAMYVFGSRADEIAERITGQQAQAADAEAGRTGQTRRPTHASHPQSDVDIGVQPQRGRVLAAIDLDAEADAQLYYLRRAADLAPFLREQWRETVGSELPSVPERVDGTL